MSNFDEPELPTGDEDNPGDEAAPAPAEQRLRDAERENARLQAQLADLRAKYEQEREIWESFALAEMPRDEAEFLRLAATGLTLSDLIDELELQYGSGPQS